MTEEKILYLYPPTLFWINWLKADELQRIDMIRNLKIPTNTKADLSTLLNSYFEDLELTLKKLNEVSE